MAVSRPFKGRSSGASSFHASLLQAIDGVMSLALCPQVVSQASQHIRSSEKQATCNACFSRQSICSVITTPTATPTPPQSTYSQFHTYVLYARAGHVRKESDGVCQCYVREKQLVWFRMPPDGQAVANFVLQLLPTVSRIRWQLAGCFLAYRIQKKGCKMTNTPINVIVHSANQLTNHMDFLKSTSD